MNEIEPFENWLQTQGKRLQTISSFSTAVNRFLDWLKTEKTKPVNVVYNDILAYASILQKQGLQPQTINGYLNAIKHYYNYLQNVGKTQENPVTALKLHNTRHRLPHDLLSNNQLKSIYDNYKTTGPTGKRNKCILGLMIYQGLTTGEISALETTDIKLEEGKLYIPSVSRGNARELELKAFQIIGLQNYILQSRPLILTLNEKESTKLFVSSGTGNTLKNSLQKLMKSLFKKHKKLHSFKQIRASVITLWLKKHNLRQVQYMAGHKYTSSTEQYRTDLTEALQKKVEQLHPLNKGNAS